MIREVDHDKNGTIELDEFLLLMGKQMKSDEDDDIKEAFKVFDKDGNGKISFDELKQVMKSIGEDLTDDQVREMMKEVSKWSCWC